MNVPINCPICGNALVNMFNQTTDKVVYKNCRLRPDHIFSCVVYLPNFFGCEIERVERIAFTLSMVPQLSIVIYPDVKKMGVDKSLPVETGSLFNYKKLPFYIEPDFSNYKKLVEKIKTYILFS